ncbi:F-box protein DOR-like [Silene latifolia]|uniref:F-box protein DOR-like n=1 Tax=Silene latifolia TaxID=37657 RepID=UPI003D770348
MSDPSFEDIPEEIQIEILSRLPPESLSRCKFVSKHWKDTLTIKAFLLNQSLSYNIHSKRSVMALAQSVPGKFNSILLFELTDNTHNTTPLTVPKATPMSVVISWENGRKTSFEEVIIGYQPDSTRRLAAWHEHMSNICNDLVCIFNESTKRVGLVNVKTQDSIRLPAIKVGCVDSFLRFWYALGFDPVNKVFKVLSINDLSKGCGTKAAILTVGSKYWKPIEYECLPCSVTENSRSSNNSFCLDGVIYWVNETEIGLYGTMLTVVAFDLNCETFRDYELVDKDDGPFGYYYLTSLKGCPTLFIWDWESDEIQQWTLFNHKNPNVAWNKTSFIAHDFPKIFNYGCRWTCVAGSSILVHQVTPQDFVEPSEPLFWYWNWYMLYDLEKFAVE